MNLTKRLSLIADLVEAGSSVCDVGTDHGYLPAFLYKSGKVKSVCATDINKKPLNNAKQTFIKEDIKDIPLYLCDGLQNISRDMADTVIIAGMGGEVISGIIDRAEFLRDDTVTLILQPTTSADKLREYLAKEGFVVVCEKAVKDNGKLYSVMKAHFCGMSYPADCVRLAIGLIRPDYEAGRAYIEKQCRIAESRAQELEISGKKPLLCMESRTLADRLKKILERGI